MSARTVRGVHDDALETRVDELLDQLETLVEAISDDELASPLLAARAETIAVKMVETRRALNAAQAARG